MLAALQTTLTDNFAASGYAIIDLPAFDADRIVAELAFDENHRIENAWRQCEEVRTLATMPFVLDTLAELHGRPAFPFQTLNFDRGTEQMAHSDTIHFDSDPPGFMAGVWVALEDVDAENGPLFYYPGSQTLPQMTLADFGVEHIGEQNPYKLYQTHYELGIQQVIADHGLERRELHIRKGQALIWSANLLHGGTKIIDESSTRHSQVTHYYFEGFSYHTPLLSDAREGLIPATPWTSGPERMSAATATENRCASPWRTVSKARPGGCCGWAQGMAGCASISRASRSGFEAKPPSSRCWQKRRPRHR